MVQETADYRAENRADSPSTDGGEAISEKDLRRMEKERKEQEKRMKLERERAEKLARKEHDRLDKLAKKKEKEEVKAKKKSPKHTEIEPQQTSPSPVYTDEVDDVVPSLDRSPPVSPIGKSVTVN